MFICIYCISGTQPFSDPQDFQPLFLGCKYNHICIIADIVRCVTI